MPLYFLGHVTRRPGILLLVSTNYIIVNNSSIYFSHAADLVVCYFKEQHFFVVSNKTRKIQVMSLREILFKQVLTSF